jgi:flagellar biosynthesis GTPase FlhF
MHQFSGPTIEEALQQATAELGRDITVVRARRVTSKRTLGFGSKVRYEVDVLVGAQAVGSSSGSGGEFDSVLSGLIDNIERLEADQVRRPRPAADEELAPANAESSRAAFGEADLAPAPGGYGPSRRRSVPSGMDRDGTELSADRGGRSGSIDLRPVRSEVGDDVLAQLADQPAGGRNGSDRTPPSVRLARAAADAGPKGRATVTDDRPAVRAVRNAAASEDDGPAVESLARAARRAAERAAAARSGEAERRDAERLEVERLLAEREEREAAERRADEDRRLARLEAERLAAERAERERAEAERLAAERVERERVEAERLAAERAERERVEAERLAAERAERERVEAERLAVERLVAEHIERERVEAERLAVERAERERVEAERLAAERAERERIERLASEVAEAARIEAERVAAELRETARIEVERALAERAGAQQVAPGAGDRDDDRDRRRPVAEDTVTGSERRRRRELEREVAEAWQAARQVRSGTWGTPRPADEPLPARAVDHILDAEWLSDDADPTVIDLVDRAFAADELHFDDLLILDDEPAEAVEVAEPVEAVDEPGNHTGDDTGDHTGDDTFAVPSVEAVLVEADLVESAGTEPVAEFAVDATGRPPRRRLRDLQRNGARPAAEAERETPTDREPVSRPGAEVEILPPLGASSPFSTKRSAGLMTTLGSSRQLPARSRRPERGLVGLGLEGMPFDQSLGGEPQWSIEHLGALGMPEVALEALAELELNADADWMSAVELFIREHVPAPSAAGDPGAVFLSGAGPEAATSIVQAGLLGFRPGYIVVDGQFRLASSIELMLAIRSCLPR